MGQFPHYPRDHKVGMEVPLNGSDCAKCEYVRNHDRECANEKWSAWHGSHILPKPANRYCCDFFEAAEPSVKEKYFGKK